MKKGRLFIHLGIIIAVIVVVLYTVQVVFISRFTRKSLMQNAYFEYSEFSRLYAREITAELEKSKRSMDFYVKADVCRTENPAAIVSWLQDHTEERHSDFDYVAFVDREGNFNSDIKKHTVVTDRDYFQAIMNDGADSFIDNPSPSKNSGEMVIHICRAVKAGGKTIGFFSGNTTPKKINRIVERIKIGDEGFAVLVSGTGSVIAASGEMEEIGSLVSDADIKRLMDSDAKNSVINIADETYHVFYDSVGGTEWKNLILIPEAQILQASSSVSFLIITANVIIGCFIIIISCIVIASETRPLTLVERSVGRIASGNADLTRRIILKKESNNEIGSLVNGFNTFIEKLQSIIAVVKNLKDELVRTGQDLTAGMEDTSSSINEIISNISGMEDNIANNSNSVHQTAGAVNQISSSIESLNNLIENQSSSVSQASAAVEQMIGNINSVNSSVVKMAESFENLETKSLEGVQKQEDVNSRIVFIANESETLKEANSVISSIADQTNLLAMNAAIEAAHAGEAGKGFSVVADEIRKLSETSSEQSKTIGEQLRKITAGIEEIVAVSKDASQTFSSVSAGMRQTNSLVAQIKSAMQEQEEGSRQISIALNNMNDSTIQVRDASREMSDGSKTILREIEALKESTVSMKSSMDEMSGGARKINDTGSALSGISRLMTESIKKIDDEVNLFKV